MKKLLMAVCLFVISNSLFAQTPAAAEKWVDLGLSVKWAAYNVGASAPEQLGDYFAFGEIKTKSSYSSSNCATGYIDEDNDFASKRIDVITGNSMYDAARVKWGAPARIPTNNEARELLEKCSWKWMDDYKGAQGMLVTGPNGNSIFLPAAGARENLYNSWAIGSKGAYWTATPLKDTRWDKGEAIVLRFNNDHERYSTNLKRFRGCSIRAVCNK